MTDFFTSDSDTESEFSGFGESDLEIPNEHFYSDDESSSGDEQQDDGLDKALFTSYGVF